MPRSASIAAAIDTWLLAVTGIATSHLNGMFVCPSDVSVPTFVELPIVMVCCSVRPSPVNCIAKVAAPAVAPSCATLAIMPTIALLPAGTCTLLVVDCPYKLVKAVKLSAAVTLPSLTLYDAMFLPIV